MDYRKTYFIGFLVICVLLFLDAIIQPNYSEINCATFFLERILLLVLALIFISGALLHTSKITKNIAAIAGMMVSVCGMYVSIHHEWLHHLGISVASQLPQISFTQMQAIPIIQLFEIGVIGNEACVHPIIIVAGLDLPIWLIIFFTVFCVFSFWQLRRTIE